MKIKEAYPAVVPATWLMRQAVRKQEPLHAQAAQGGITAVGAEPALVKMDINGQEMVLNVLLRPIPLI